MAQKTKARRILGDSFFSIFGLVMMNAAMQFALFPSWSRTFGTEEYGNILYLLSYINIPAVSCGTALNYARMVASVRGETKNGDYNAVWLVLCLIAVPYSLVVTLLHNGTSFFLFFPLLCLTMIRYYADVEYRLHINYKGYCVYYLLIGLGYLLGVWLSRKSGYWESAMLLGEALGLAFVLIRGTTIRTGFFKTSSALRGCMKSTSILLATNLISNLIFNADRLLLRHLIDGTAVTVYYLATLIGKAMSLVTTPLNSVIMGYLARYQGKATWKMYRALLLILLALFVCATVGCTVATHIVIRLLYPDNYAAVKPLILIASVSQVIYFLTNVLTVVLLRFSAQRYQLYINLCFGISFVACAVPMTLQGGIEGFSAAFLIANLVRLGTGILLGIHALRTQSGEEEAT